MYKWATVKSICLYMHMKVVQGVKAQNGLSLLGQTNPVFSSTNFLAMKFRSAVTGVYGGTEWTLGLREFILLTHD